MASYSLTKEDWLAATCITFASRDVVCLVVDVGIPRRFTLLLPSNVSSSRLVVPATLLFLTLFCRKPLAKSSLADPGPICSCPSRAKARSATRTTRAINAQRAAEIVEMLNIVCW